VDALMDFGLTLEQRQFDDSLRDFLKDRLPMDRLRLLAETANGFDEGLWQGVIELGVLDAAVAGEALGFAAAPLPFTGSMAMAPLAFVHCATQAQQDEWLPRIAAGEVRFAVAFTGLAGQTGSATTSQTTGLNRAVAYAKERIQFGRVIGSFQGVKYPLADCVTALEPCRAMVWYAAYAQDALPEEARLTACHAKAHVCDVARDVARMTTEAHGGMGFTDLLGLH
jgi:alkylation response protein AidB-like acyl-CoA dehydrogenase